MNDLKVKGKPFIKWVGGKGQLLPQLENALPEKLYTEEFSHIEPFVGGGATMLFPMLQKFPEITKVVINDIKPYLVTAYRTNKDNPQELIGRLTEFERQYLGQESEEAKRSSFLMHEGSSMKTFWTKLTVRKTFMNH